MSLNNTSQRSRVKYLYTFETVIQFVLRIYEFVYVCRHNLANRHRFILTEKIQARVDHNVVHRHLIFDIKTTHIHFDFLRNVLSWAQVLQTSPYPI